MLQSSLFLATLLLHLGGSDVFPADFTDVPLELTEEPSYRFVKAWNRRDKDPSQPIYNPAFLRNTSLSRSNEPPLCPP